MNTVYISKLAKENLQSEVLELAKAFEGKVVISLSLIDIDKMLNDLFISNLQTNNCFTFFNLSAIELYHMLMLASIIKD